AAEGDLRRTSRDELERTAPGALIQSAESGFEDDSQRQADLSEKPWLYLLFLVTLVAEQALAVHLSFHVKGEAAAPPAARPLAA
ncbi:MAG: hypothetical protein NZ700_04890, partial [Gemmataceae bacterium]|nr:hypothetical protein [Gemmataceae bacterium]MDW8267474.1 hypothetical protein [Gemmataceae bacterium]